MPIIYRQRTTSISSDPESDHHSRPPPSNVPEVDDTIVLSDLVRRGEASRLRRRGAMRLDHGNLVHNSSHRNSTPPAIFIEPSSWEDQRNNPPPTSSRSMRPSRPSRRNAEDDQEEYRYTLVCRGYSEDSNTDCISSNGSPASYEPSILPLHPTSSSTTIVLPRRKPISGCGALIHVHAAPRSKLNVWTAKSEASSAVVPLDSSYFDQIVIGKMMKNSCGCVREGIGCAVCGNPLGTRYKPCKTAGDGIFTSCAKPSGPLYPGGPRYWHGTSNPSSSSSQSSHPFFVYTFFASAVTSFPAHDFPHRSRPQYSTETRSQIIQPAPVQQSSRWLAPPAPVDSSAEAREGIPSRVFDDRYLNESPANLSDDDQEPYQGSLIAAGSSVYVPPSTPNEQALDPDGEMITLHESESLDKSTEVTIFPER